MRNHKGFSLAEVLIVIVIIGILGALALPRFFPQKEKAYVAEAAGVLSAIRQGEMIYDLENGVYLAIGTGGGTTWGQVGIDDPNGSTLFSYSVDVNGTGLATRLAPADADFLGDTITLTIGGTWGGSHDFAPKN